MVAYALVSSCIDKEGETRHKTIHVSSTNIHYVRKGGGTPAGNRTCLVLAMFPGLPTIQFDRLQYTKTEGEGQVHLIM